MGKLFVGVLWDNITEPRATYSSQGTNITVVHEGDYTVVNSALESEQGLTNSEIAAGGLRLRPPQNANVAMTTVYEGNVTNIQNQQDSSAEVRTSLGRIGREVMKITQKWHVTFSTGLPTGERWLGCCAITDSGCNDNWIQHDVLVSAGLGDHILEVPGDPAIYKGAIGEHRADRFIPLYWYVDQAGTCRPDNFFVSSTIPVSMILGKEYIDEFLQSYFPEAYEYNPRKVDEDKDKKTILPHIWTRLEPRTKGKY